MNTNTFNGPHGWMLVADRREVFPDDPGNGTPLMVYAPKATASGTLGRVLDTAEVDEARNANAREVPGDVMTWLENVADQAQTFVYGD
ncbi:hypothetical protein [Luteimonas sp. MC1750]|uniref:hypothetical protein n=1 Tax=Luteimonas sp. MC1750 TaxID=2799326 RepID=UPI0018F0AD54|nr:hypothetical protein [Luteimonas sp. MC1750]MBJ6984015.1 hypothetical protein [Luteimonas sp. MC1750]QQO06827.1 hypothetical protein JGR68_05215 [Luteimonas sp. MC1750]